MVVYPLFLLLVLLSLVPLLLLQLLPVFVLTFVSGGSSFISVVGVSILDLLASTIAAASIGYVAATFEVKVVSSVLGDVVLADA